MLKLSGSQKKYLFLSYLLVYGPGTQTGFRWIIILLYLAFAVVTGDHLAAGLGGSIQDGLFTCLTQG